MPTQSYAAYNAHDDLKPFSFTRRQTGEQDVRIDILYCGVCHSDIHQARNEWGGSRYPMVPGHEIVGRIMEVGSEVKKFKVGDLVGVGVFVDSCRHCKPCKQGFDNYCAEGMTGTYNALERDGISVTYGGYSTDIVVNEHYVLRVSTHANLAAVAPLLCAGITTYSPLKYARVGPGMRVGIVGLGGLGHMGVKFAASFGAEVTVISTSPNKEADARALGAHHFLVSTNQKAMQDADSQFDVVLDTISANHDYTGYLRLLDLDGRLLVVGLPVDKPRVAPGELVKNRRSITGSMIGSIQETQEMLDYCAEKGIVAEVEMITMQQINQAYARMIANDVKYRFVIDLASLK